MKQIEQCIYNQHLSPVHDSVPNVCQSSFSYGLDTREKRMRKFTVRERKRENVKDYEKGDE